MVDITIVIAFSWFISGLTLVYGRYFTLVNGDYFRVYKPTNITVGPHPVPKQAQQCLAMSFNCVAKRRVDLSHKRAGRLPRRKLRVKRLGDGYKMNNIYIYVTQ